MVQNSKIGISFPPHLQFIQTTSSTFPALVTTVIFLSFQSFFVHIQVNMNTSIDLFVYLTNYQVFQAKNREIPVSPKMTF